MHMYVCRNNHDLQDHFAIQSVIVIVFNDSESELTDVGFFVNCGVTDVEEITLAP